MARGTSRMGLASAGVLLAASCGLGAQSVALPATDPVGIGRAGAGVAFGQSLEAASLNPALLVTLRDPRSAFLSWGMDLRSSFQTLQSNQQSLSSDHRNRNITAFGSAWRLGDTFALGLKMDQPFQLHGGLSSNASTRYSRSYIDLDSRRVELQGAWAPDPHWSFGVGVGLTRVQYTSEVRVRTAVPVDGSQALSGSNPELGLVEVPLRQEGSKTVPSYTLGFRWAINPRWTVGGTYQGAVRTSLLSSASYGDSQYCNSDGFSSALLGTSVQGASMLRASSVQTGGGDLKLPSRASLGVRQRVSQIFTWEVDLRYTSSYRLPEEASLVTPSGTVSSPFVYTDFKGGFGASGTMEFSIGKRWTARLGVALDPATRDDTAVEPLAGGASSAGFGAGFSYAVWGGSLSVGYLVRQAQDLENTSMDGVWTSSGFRSTGTLMKIENQGHLWAVGFKKAF